MIMEKEDRNLSSKPFFKKFSPCSTERNNSTKSFRAYREVSNFTVVYACKGPLQGDLASLKDSYFTECLSL